MAKRGSGSEVWAVVGLLVIVVLVPREIWIALGVIAALAFVIYIYVRWKAKSAVQSGSHQSGHSPSPLLNNPLASDNQPTLAELMARSERAARTTQVQQASPPPLPTALTPTPPTSQPRALSSQPTSSSASSTYRPNDQPKRDAPVCEPPTVASIPRDPDREFYNTVVADTTQSQSQHSFAVPKPPVGFGDARWVSPEDVVEIAGTLLPGGLFYIGARLQAPNGRTDPCLISAQHNVARHGDFRERQTNYWPSYADISASARRAYLNWLADGRSHPECDLGYVFIFFYGLERRVILDTPKDPSAKQDWPAIAAELRRLLTIYGDKSGSFRRYAGELLDWMELDTVAERLYDQPVPSFPESYELPRYLRLALGQSAVDRAPIPASLALAWVRLNPGIYLRTAATRCPEEFERLFAERYHEILGPGLVLPKNRTKLKFVYQAASSSFHGSSTLTRSFGDIPDVTALTSPIKTLQEIVDQCTDELGAFSRVVGKDPSARNTLDGLLQLPASLWPVDAQVKLQSIIARMKDGMLSTSLGELIAMLGGANQAFNRDKTRGLARALEASQVGMEPNVLAGAKTPIEKDPVVLFSMPSAEAQVLDSSVYQTASLTLQLASAVAQADGEFNAGEVAHLRTEIQNWNHLTPAHQRRLQAHLQWLVAAPVTLASLKKKLEPLEVKAKETVAASMATLAQADGIVSPEEMRFLEKVYKALGVEPKRVFSDVHAVSSGGGTTKRTDQVGFRLDTKRIAELQQDTEKVTALLAGIFTEEEAMPIVVMPEELKETAADTGLLGLDEVHTALVRLMLSRPEWTRSELEDAAADLELMLDGALEHINEASFDAYDLPFTEGEDPVEINAEVMEKIES